MKRISRLMSACCIVWIVFGVASNAGARDTAPRFGDIPEIQASALPSEGRATLALIRQGGPYPYAKDGSVFSNRERILPAAPRGYYREFTVKTPHARDRGARRIICGGTAVKQLGHEACYYTDDHYASFRKIKE